jgi:ADP-ribosylglycohydrolase
MGIEFEKRMEGCINGSIIGAELGFSRFIKPEKFYVKNPQEIFSVKLERITDYKEEKYRIVSRSLLPFIRAGIEVYLKKRKRVMPEDFAEIIKDDEEISEGVFLWDNIHTIQEILKEGMHPRLSGIGATPTGIICASMIGVGIYHAGDPEYAYIDGFELASVLQPKIGADWAGLCASMIASAFIPEIKSSEIVGNVMKIAFSNNKEIFYQLSYFLNECKWNFTSENDFLNWWFYNGGRTEWHKLGRWIAPNPLYHILPLLEIFGNDFYKIFTLLLVPGNSSSIVSPVVCGSILGALYGKEIFPQNLLEWSEPIADKWIKIKDIVVNRISEERKIIKIIENLNHRNKTEELVLFDKVYGGLLAGAIGNAMGSPVECKFYWEIDEKYPEGIKTVLNPDRLEGEDDNQMAMLLVETYIERDGNPVTPKHFAETWKKKLNEYHFYPHCMGSTYRMIMEGWDPRIVGHWKPVTGSTVMCMEPVGIYHMSDPEFAYIDATLISYMYQRGLDVICAGLLSVAVSEAFKPDVDANSICKKVLEFAPREKLKTFDKRPFRSIYEYLETCLEIADKYDDVFEVRKPLYEKCLFYHPIDPLEVLGLSLAIFKVSKGDVRKSAIGGTNIGRDSDTIAGRSAMLSGILKGAKNVPSEWVSLFKQESIERIKNNAMKIVNLILNKKLKRMKERQNILK